MKNLIIGLDGGTSEYIFSDERLANIRRLMEYGCYGKLSSEETLDRVGMWMSLVAGQALGPLGEAGTEDWEAIQGRPIWKQIEEQDKNVFIIGNPPFISYPEETETRFKNLLQDIGLPADNSINNDNSYQINHIYAVSKKRLEFIQNLMRSEEWEYLHFIDDGLYQLQLSGISDLKNSEEILSDYYLYLDEQIGTILELLGNDTVVLVVGLCSAKPFDGSIILASANNPLEGEIEEVHLLDIAPTLLELGGYEVPTVMQGNSLVAGKIRETRSDDELTAEEEEILRERLSGLGYIS